MGRIRVTLNSGESGTIDQRDYDPQSMEINYSLPQKIVKALPEIFSGAGAIGGGLLGGTAGSIIPGAGTAAGAIGGAGLGGGIGAGAGYALKDTLSDLVGLPKNFNPNSRSFEERLTPLKEAGGEIVSGAASGAIGQGVGIVGGKIAGKTLSKIGLNKFLRGPATARTAAEELKNVTGKGLEDILTSSGKTIKAQPIIDQLTVILKEQQSINNTAGVNTIQKMINQISGIGDDIPANIANKLKSSWASEISNLLQSGKTSAKVATVGRRVGGGELASQVKSAVPEAVGPMKEYADLSKIAGNLQNPAKGYTKGLIPGTAASLLLGPQMGAPVGLGVSTAAMPYTRYLLRLLLGRGLQASQVPTQQALQNLLGPE